MAKRAPPPIPTPARVSPDEMRTAILKLHRRIEELQAVDVNAIQKRGDPALEALEHKIDDALIEIFGNDTVEYNRFHVGSLDTAGYSFGSGTPLHEVREGYQRGIEGAISNLTTIVELFEEKLRDLGESSSGKALRAIADLRLHPEIERAVSKLFEDGHYANAVEDACKVLDGLVRIRSGKFDLGGTDLMQTVFSSKNPVLRFSDLVNDSERSEQQGMMFLYAGAMLAFRNPRAHGLLKDDPEEALEIITFISFLAKALDQARR
jgi:uncharacterized protein (TIGR02391 family)